MNTIELLQQDLNNLKNKDVSLENVYSFISGYCSSYRGRNKKNIPDDINHKFHILFGNWLNYWVSEHYNVNHDQLIYYLWDDTIKMLARNEKEEKIWLYFLFDLFFEEYRKPGFFEKVFNDTDVNI